ncbi:CxC2 domain-containing protein [Favolaschia claudopus]|uniref:CxC2 domain-containing protein n=1 Tax=Favolaschia claudopus TaxID=2862362 RepID=A0AAW0DM84_9AGAR
MDTLNVSPARPGRRFDRVNSFVEFESHANDTTYDTEFTPSKDGRRGHRVSVNVQTKRRKLHPSELEDAFGDWVPLHEGLNGLDLDGESGEGEEDGAAGEKRKRYDSSDDPMKVWRPLSGLFLDELLRREGLGGKSAAECSCCSSALDEGEAPVRCDECGDFVQCRACVVSRHELMPLHSVERWNGRFWVKSSLASLGCVYQLGHGGFRCPRPASHPREMVVLHFPNIFTIKYRYCGCDVSDHANNLQQLLRNGWYPATTVDPATCATIATLKIFRLLNVVGNLTVHDFIKTVERSSDAAGLHSVPDRYKSFGLISRQFVFLQRLMRAGRGHDERGVEGTKAGECALLCWACPHAGINLPEGWREVSPEFQFLFILIVAMDANFRLRNRLRHNEKDDPPLGSGWGYMVEEKKYREHLRGYVGEEDISTCVAFQALLQKDTRVTTGLRCSGVGGVVCARHEVVRPQGLGDLQKGERYANMDYILLSSVLGITAMYLAISYDIACQWRIKFPLRLKEMPEKLRLDLASITVLFALPVWHAAAHERTCQVQNSLSYTVGVGRTDGEGVERVWSRLNPLAWATREKGRGGRADAIEDEVDFLNFEKNINLGMTLPRKLVVAIDERDRQVAGFQQVDETLEEETREEWQSVIDCWQRDRTSKNPYAPAEESKEYSAAAIRVQLTQEELDEASAGAGEERLHATSMSTFLVAGLQLETDQLRIRRELKGRPLLVGDQSERVAQLRRSFFVKLARFRKVQGVYMPGAGEQLLEDEETRNPDLPPPLAEDVRIYLPSELPARRREVCAEKLREREARLRRGVLADSVAKLRRSLLAKHHLVDWREGAVGQRGTTRAATLVKRVEERIEWIAKGYKRSRDALVGLVGLGECDWRELRADDLRIEEELEDDTAARRRLGNVGSQTRERRISKAAGKRSKEKGKTKKKHKMSWIWTSGGGPGGDEEELRDAVRVEWSKAKARRDRWVEEVQLLREEMRRVLRFLAWRAGWWEERAVSGREVREDVREGVQAYAARQAAMTRQIARRFRSAWDTSASQAVRAAIAEDREIVEMIEAE